MPAAMPPLDDYDVPSVAAGEGRLKLCHALPIYPSTGIVRASWYPIALTRP